MFRRRKNAVKPNRRVHMGTATREASLPSKESDRKKTPPLRNEISSSAKDVTAAMRTHTPTAEKIVLSEDKILSSGNEVKPPPAPQTPVSALPGDLIVGRDKRLFRREESVGRHVDRKGSVLSSDQIPSSVSMLI